MKIGDAYQVQGQSLICMLFFMTFFSVQWELGVSHVDFGYFDGIDY